MENFIFMQSQIIINNDPVIHKEVLNSHFFKKIWIMI